MKKNDVVIIIGVAILISILFISNQSIDLKDSNEVEIYVNNKLYKTTSKLRENEFEIKENNNYNVIKVHNNGVEMLDSSCPDKVCVKMGHISKPSQSIVCIPNKVNIKIKSSNNDDNKVDVISN